MVSGPGLNDEKKTVVLRLEKELGLKASLVEVLRRDLEGVGAELRAEQQWQRLKGALAYAEQHCGGDLLNHVLEVQAEGLWILHAIPTEEQSC